MGLNKNDYKQFYSLTLEKGDSLRANENVYLKAQYSKKQLIDFFKKSVEEDDNFSQKFKDFIKTSNNINYRMIYVSYYETSCDLYWDSYIYDDYDYQYVYNGTYYHSTLKDSKFSPLLNIFRSIDGIRIGQSEEGIDIVTNCNQVVDMYDEMVENEKIRWDNEGTVPLEDIRNQQWLTLHVPVLIIGYEYENEKYFSIIHAVSQQKYIAGAYSEEFILNDLITKSKNGDSNAQFDLGYKYEKEGNFKDALLWYEKASTKNVVALNNLGNLYYHGSGCEKDYNKAFKCYKEASEKKYNVAVFNMGICYKYGNGCEKNMEKAIDYFTKADKMGYARAKEQLDKIFNDDRTKDDAILAKTFKTMEKDCFGGFITDKVAVTKFKPNKNKEISDIFGSGLYSTELNLLNNAAENGNGKATYFLGYYIEKNYDEGHKKSLEYYKKSAEQGYPLGYLQLARYSYPYKKEYYEDKLDLYTKFVSYDISKWADLKEYFSIAYYELYLLMKNFKSPDKLNMYQYLYLADKKGCFKAGIALIKAKDPIAKYFNAIRLKEDNYHNAYITVLTVSAKKGFIKAQYELASYLEKNGERKKAFKWYKKVLKNKDNSLAEFAKYKSIAKAVVVDGM